MRSSNGYALPKFSVQNYSRIGAVRAADSAAGAGWVEEVPGVNAQEPSREELLASLRLTLAEALDFNRKEAREAAESDFEEETLSA